MIADLVRDPLDLAERAEAGALGPEDGYRLIRARGTELARLACDADGTQLYILGGNYRVTRRGLEG